MSKPTWHLTVRSEFCAAHALRHYKGKCERLHGHNYGIKIIVGGHELTSDTELLIDFTELKAILKDVLEPLDHRYLNNIPPFDQINPSAENLARYIWQNVKKRLPPNVYMVQATVAERNVQSATYME
ncbi:6-carboxytetrahydropterin synthase QueD [Lawsonia intracellularis]|uniref:6-carboxy-5,6,7,8-tetrahydropterin synthase n=1 Tax=Lawsonia intracellularis (strain PHE/MN1-00) TaxID=363253 RepID=Q1MRR2_LAWIP|nr:6-carboxytetrahydropterin synthase QueD [Lawsonia intracellularis]AGC49667.1 6-pyruvoyl-tetrahydropterin synthase [Lawsonia intracellularis N343]KAA0205172.1 6-carboxytetrahydropterin synthase QueD [Lawsonia intracellularis]MBZ3892299.1 6-carboxytetrahydropterin synthase QueD [Lawsonia intracellularis]OMQ05888.1 6-carboxytetrahydropterin synthase QueD [Lawsonia intracellularis]RBN32281.1 6-carboxytetrahydropterin synthase QueD [Lawsonia intracellularis]